MWTPDGTAASVIAQAIDRRYPGLGQHDYIDFYMGSLGYPATLDLTPVYRWIFQRLKEAGCEWKYSFPRLYLVEFAAPVEENDPLTYDASEAVRAGLEEARRAERARDLTEELERGHQEDVRNAREAPLPPIVSAYRDVYAVLPEGWPHPDM